MLREYRRQLERLKLLRDYKAIVTLSEHMAAEFIKHGIPLDCIYTLASPLSNGSLQKAYEIPEVGPSTTMSGKCAVQNNSRMDYQSTPPWRLLFLGRMDFLKGGCLFLSALPHVASSLDRPLRVIFAGDGPDRSAWESQAARSKDQSRGLEIKFVGWLEGDKREAVLADSDLLVMPSQWPEPFGLSGLEAGQCGVPAVAFAVGGIPQWLEDGVNGTLAPGNPPTAAGLSDAIVRALRDPDTHAHLRQGALERATKHTLQQHLAQLFPVLERYAR